MKKLPISILAKRFGNLGRRIWYMCQGADPEPIQTKVPNPKSMGHGKVMPPNTHSSAVIESYLMHMCEKLATCLRHHHFRAQHFFAGVRSYELGWFGSTGQTIQTTHDGKEIFQLALFLLNPTWNNQPVSHIQVTALDPRSDGFQLDLLTELDDKREQLNFVIYKINDKYGEFTIAPAPLLSRSSMPNVIAPAWKPYGPAKQFEKSIMPEAVTFRYQDKVQTVYFARAKAMLPVKLSSVEIKFVTWGRRQQEEGESRDFLNFKIMTLQ